MLKAVGLLGNALSKSCLARSNRCLYGLPASSLRLRPNNTLWSIQGTRFIMEKPYGEVSASVEEAMKARDDIPSEYRIIYRAPHEYYVKITYMSAVIAVATMPVLTAGAYLASDTKTFPMSMGGIPLFESIIDVYIMLGFLSMTIFNIALTVAKYPMRIYRNPLENTYIAIFQHPVPGLNQRLPFVAGEVAKCEAWVWKDSTYQIKNKKKVYLLDENFSAPIELQRMLVAPYKDSLVEKTKRRSRMV